MSTLRIALPSKGWEDDTLRFLGQCGLRIDRSNPRQYRARMRGLPTGPVEVVFQRATDIFDEVNAGSVDLGITGYDIVAEHRSEEDHIVVVHGELGFRRCALVVAVPEGWVDVTSVSDLAEVAVELRSARRELQADAERLEATRALLELMEAYLRSRQQVSITANMPGESAEAVARRVLASGGVVGGLRGPT